MKSNCLCIDAVKTIQRSKINQKPHQNNRQARDIPSVYEGLKKKYSYIRILFN